MKIEYDPKLITQNKVSKIEALFNEKLRNTKYYAKVDDWLHGCLLLYKKGILFSREICSVFPEGSNILRTRESNLEETKIIAEILEKDIYVY